MGSFLEEGRAFVGLDRYTILVYTDSGGIAMLRTATVNISFSKRLLADIDAVASEEARSRSELLREATRMYIERKRRWKSIFTFWRAEAKRRGLGPADVERAIQQARRAR
jgi:CopG family transcriptional regulator/antitoxin EndoAI